MPTVNIIDAAKKSKGKIELPDDTFALTGKTALLHGAVRNYLANQRQGTHCTKTKGLVRGGGRKPYKQKGTGRARAGSIRSPLWKGGGTAFGPRPRDYSYSMPRQARRQALYAAISEKLAADEVVVIDNLVMDEPRTKIMVGILDSLELTGISLLVVVAELQGNLALAARNIPEVRVQTANNLHAYDVLSRSKVLITSDALEALKSKAEK